MTFEIVQDYWWVIALYVSFGMAFSANLNNKFQMDGLRLKVVLATVSGTSLLPTFFFISMPTEPFFYLSMIVAAILLSINETKVLDMSAQYGGPFATLSRPLLIVLTFVIWACIEFEETVLLLSDFYVLWGVVISFLMVITGNLLIARYSVVARSGLKPLFQIAVLGALIAILIKLGMMYRETLYQVFLWTCMLNILIGIAAFVRWRFIKKDRQPICTQYMKYGSILGLLNTLVAPATTAAVALSPNPAFASVIFMLSTIWLSIYYKMIGKEAHMSFVSMILIISGVCLLTIVTNE